MAHCPSNRTDLARERIKLVGARHRGIFTLLTNRHLVRGVIFAGQIPAFSKQKLQLSDL